MSVTRLIAGLGDFRSDVVPLNDGVNLAVNIGIVAAAVYFLRADLQSRGDDLEREAGRSQAPTPDPDPDP